MENYCIYKHTFPNGKVYIGQTKCTPEDRWLNGFGYKRQAVFNAIKKYGWENIEHEILFDNLTQEEANEKEIEMIKNYNSNNKQYGYNVSAGGNNGHNDLWNCEEFRNEQIEERKSRWKSQDYRDKMKNSMIIAMSSESYKRKQSEKTSSRWINGDFDNLFCKKVICLENGIVYDSINDASRKTEINRTNIGKSCNHDMKTAGSYHWMFYDEYLSSNKTQEELINEIGHGRGIKVMCVETQVVYDSIKIAADDLNIDNSFLGKVLKSNGYNTAGGYHWKYVS